MKADIYTLPQTTPANAIPPLVPTPPSATKRTTPASSTSLVSVPLAITIKAAMVVVGTGTVNAARRMYDLGKS